MSAYRPPEDTSSSCLVREVETARRADAHAYFAQLSERDRATLRRILTTLDEQPSTRS